MFRSKYVPKVIIAKSFIPYTLLLSSVHHQWRPGAISKRLLAKLKKAKTNKSDAPAQKPLRRLKKRTEDKPTLIVAKRNGEYVIEMQVYDENENMDHCKPVIYKIESANNKEKVARKELKARRLIDEQWRKLWKDPYHPKVCEKVCLPAYQHAVGLPPYDSNNMCICPEDIVESNDDGSQIIEDDSSEFSSLDLDWELHFSPPSAFQC